MPDYFVVLKKTGERIEDIEDELVRTPTPETLQEIHALKRETIFLQKAVWPLREVIDAMALGRLRSRRNPRKSIREMFTSIPSR